MPQKSYILVPHCYKAPRLVQHGLRPAAALPAPDIGHYAVGTEVIAPVHDREPRPNCAVTLFRKTLGNGAGVVFREEEAPPVLNIVSRFGETPQHMQYKLYVPHGVGFLIFSAIPGSCAIQPQTPRYLVAVCLFRVAERAHVAEYTSACSLTAQVFITIISASASLSVISQPISESMPGVFRCPPRFADSRKCQQKPWRCRIFLREEGTVLPIISLCFEMSSLLISTRLYATIFPFFILYLHRGNFNIFL